MKTKYLSILGVLCGLAVSAVKGSDQSAAFTEAPTFWGAYTNSIGTGLRVESGYNIRCFPASISGEPVLHDRILSNRPATLCTVLLTNSGPKDVKIYMLPIPARYQMTLTDGKGKPVLPTPLGLRLATWGQFWLDGPEYYAQSPDQNSVASLNDAPGSNLIMLSGSYDGDWKTYVRFTPTGGIPVTLGRIDWSWAATCINTNQLISDTQLPSGWILTSDGVESPTLHDDDSFPLWSHVRPAPEDE